MKYLILGLGKSGLAAYQLLKAEGHTVVGIDDNRALMEKLQQEGYVIEPHPVLQEVDVVVVSPGVSPKSRFYAEALRLGKEIQGEAELALSRLHQPAVAITGTNGKTTVTLLTEHILKVSGHQARALGNVGTPLTLYLKEAHADEIVVAEMSSYQLETLRSVVFDVGIVLNITPDHLDRYASMREYAAAKCRLQDLVKPGGDFWVHQDVVDEFGALLKWGYQTYGSDPRCTYWTDQKSIRTGDKVELILPLKYGQVGKHEAENVLAVWLLCKTWGMSGDFFLNALETFQKPAHRIEFVTSINGAHYFDDSKGTNIDATMKAVQAMKGAVILIAGGVDKGASYAPWKQAFAGKVKQIVALGQAASKIEQELKEDFLVEIVPTLQDAVIRAREAAKPGENVLLSPGCSSYDMFRDYAHRGDEFKRYVLEERRKQK